MAASCGADLLPATIPGSGHEVLIQTTIATFTFCVTSRFS